MITNRFDYRYYLEADRISLGRKKNGIKGYIKDLVLPDYIWRFQRTLRKLEYLSTRKGKNPFVLINYLFTRIRFHKLSHKLNFFIPLHVFGPGLAIAHYGTIVVNGGAKVGANCRIHVGVNIGTQAGYSDKAPQIGDNVYIGPGAKLYGAIIIGNNIAIGANAVVNKSFLDENVAIAGVPAKVIGKVDTATILTRGTEIINMAGGSRF